MSVYQVNKLLYLTDNDLAFRKRMMKEPEAVIKEFSLTEEESVALTSGAVGKLYQMGVHTFLLNHLYRYELFGVNRAYDPRFERGNMPVQRFIKK
jgi:aromatic-ring opening dioxygenase LigAB LigA subunit